jgi:hypothetical protein
MSNKFEPLKENEIVSLNLDTEKPQILLTQPTYKVKEFLKALRRLVDSYDDTLTRYKQNGVEFRVTKEKVGWFSEGIDCEVLRLDAKGWQKGKVRLAIEFCPDEPEIEETPTEEIPQPQSPLDDLRQMINKETQL